MKNLKSVRSELEKVGNPFKHNRFVRTEYYINLSFKINDKTVRIKAKIDTGSPYTIIGLNNISLLKFKRLILNNRSNLEVYDATDNLLDIEQYNVSDLVLTDEVIFDKLKLCFSEALGEKAVLGMDILSLFDLKYEVSSTGGVFYLLNYQKTINRVNKFMKDNEVLLPSSILELDDFISENTNLSYEKLLEQYNIIKDELEVQKDINRGLLIINDIIGG